MECYKNIQWYIGILNGTVAELSIYLTVFPPALWKERWWAEDRLSLGPHPRVSAVVCNSGSREDDIFATKLQKRGHHSATQKSRLQVFALHEQNMIN